MKRRSLILMIAIVLLPIALLTWFGMRMAKDEQALMQQRYRSLMDQRLQDVNRIVAQRFEETERRLQQITSLNEFDLTQLRAIVRREPQVTQLFVLSPGGELLYPNPADPLNGTEQSFLRQASRMFTDRDLQNAVAQAEAGTLEQWNRPSDIRRRAVGSRPVISSSPSLTPGGDELRTSADSDSTSVASGMLSLNANDASGSSPAAAGLPPAFSDGVRDLNEVRVAAGEAMDGAGTMVESERNSEQALQGSQSSIIADAGALPQMPSRAAAGKAFPETSESVQDESLVRAELPVQRAEGYIVDPSQKSGGLPVQTDALAAQAVDAMAFQQNALEASQIAGYPESRGWFVWYWDRGMNLVYWQRRPSGHIVGAALERARWIADLISWLPESSEVTQGSSGVDTAFRVVTSSVEPVYRWGADFELDGPPYCEAPLASPLASWRLQCFVPASQLVDGRGSIMFGLSTGIVAFALTLCGLAWFLYRDYSRDMREASQQVSFVNQVSHELKTPLTNIRMYAELLERDLDQVSEDQSKKPLRRLEIINAEAQRLSRLIGNVLTFARQRRKTLQISPARLDPVILVRSISERFLPSLQEKSIELQLESDRGRILNLDADFVEQILGNLISNVEKYAAGGKLLRIRTTCSDSCVTIDVMDAGPGIPVQYRSSVFEPFERLHNDLRASSGTGIGLSIARDLARLHGGDLTLQASDNGCWFQCRLASISAVPASL